MPLYLFLGAIAICTLGLSVNMGVAADRFRTMPKYKWVCVAASILCGAMALYSAYLIGTMTP